MPTAKKYMNYDHDEPFMENGKMYVHICTGENRYTGTLYTKTVRWYSDAEWNKMYGEPKVVNYRTTLGFGEAGYVTIYYGNTYENLSWFKAEPECRYSRIFGWYTTSKEEVSNALPEGVKTAKLLWNDVCDNNNEFNESMATKAVDTIRHPAPENAGEFVGEIDERRDFVLTIEKAITLDGFYGPSTMHIMKDANGNTFVWTTASKTLEVGHTYEMRGRIKDHKEYRGVKQTILTRCTSIKEK